VNAPEPAIAFRDLLAYTDYLAQRWLDYFEEHPQALTVDVGGKTGLIRDLVAHIVQVERFFSERLLTGEATRPTELASPTLLELRQIHEEAHRKLNEYVQIASEERLRQTQVFASTAVSNRKVFAQVVLHSVHHWAQVAMEVRQAGFPPEKPQDIIISSVME
jgi:uncharacterized damage-inducible protein DinB